MSQSGHTCHPPASPWATVASSIRCPRAPGHPSKAWSLNEPPSDVQGQRTVSNRSLARVVAASWARRGSRTTTVPSAFSRYSPDRTSASA